MSSGPRSLLTLRVSSGLTEMLPRLGASRWSAPLVSMGAMPTVRMRAVTPSAPNARKPRRTRDNENMSQSPPVGGWASYGARLEEVRGDGGGASMGGM